MNSKIIYGLIIFLNCTFALLAININTNLFYYLGVIVSMATIAFVLFIKVFRRESMLFQKISTQQALIMLGIMVLFILAGIIQTHMFQKSVIQ